MKATDSGESPKNTPTKSDRIVIYLLALDCKNHGTGVEWFYSEEERYRYMLDVFTDDYESDEYKAALAAVEDGSFAIVEEFLADRGESISATWQFDKAVIDPAQCEAAEPNTHE